MTPLTRWTLVSVLIFLALPIAAQVDARLMREPAVSNSQVAFVYGGDIWVAPKSGGVAQHLTTPKGEEHFPRFSPDGSRIAFTGNYDGNYDVYVMPAAGGVPLRLTYHSAPDRLVGWYPDGRAVLVASPRESGSYRFSQLYRVPIGGGPAEKLPVPYGEFGAVSPDGKTLALVPNSQDSRTWKRYRGGDVSRIYLVDLQAHTSRRVGDDGASYSQPMWHGAMLYLMSDRDANKRYNIWAFDTASGAFKPLTYFETEDVHFPSIGPSDIVFQAGGRIYRLDLATGKYAPVDIEVATDLATVKPRIENAADFIANVDVSPSGKRAVVEARGDLFSVPAGEGVVLDMTRTPGVAERYPAWSPDGKWIAYWSDRTGDYELTLRPADGLGAERTVTALGPGYRYRIFWSPDSTKIVFMDQTMTVHLCDVATGKVERLDQGLWLFEEVQNEGHECLPCFTASWSADSRWVSWARENEAENGVIFLHDTQNGKTSQVTSGFYYDFSPTFDPGGQYLFLLTRRTFKPVYSPDTTWIYANMTGVAAVSLRPDVPSLLAPKNDAEEEKKEPAGKDKDAKPEKPAKPEPVTITMDGFEQRMVLLPPKAGNYARLLAVPGKVLYQMPPRAGSEDEKSPVLYYDLKEREEKTIFADADLYIPAAGGEKILVQKKKDFAFVDVKPDQKMEKKLPASDLQMEVDPRAEWRQIFTDAWRFERDFFYDPRLHGEDWNALRVRYGALIEQCVTRWDVNYILGELIGELNSSHTYRGGGDMEKAEKRGVGLLGCDLVLENGAYRIKTIVKGAPWDLDPRSPLAEPGLGIRERDYLMAVNGAPLDPGKEPWAALDGLDGKTVVLSVNGRPETAGARQILVKTLDDEGEHALRHLAWVESNRAKVEKATGGRIGYLYVPDTGTDGQNDLYRQFMGQFKKEGLIIDERFNSGGQIPDRFIELLNRPITNYWRVRDGMDWPWPPFSNTGPKVMLINGWSGSGGDCFPLFFRAAKLGPLVGRRTWGGLIGISGSPAFVDGGTVTVPTFGMYSPDGKWLVEGHGVEPDIPVDDDPAAMMNGSDPQLERGIAEILNLLNAQPPPAPKRPAYEDRSGK